MALIVNCNATNSGIPVTLSSAFISLGNLFISFFGMTTNVFTLIVFHRIKWFKRKQLLLFVVSTTANFISCLTMFIPRFVLILMTFCEENYVWRQFTCVAFQVPSSIAFTSTQEFILLVALDRMGAQWSSFDWLRMKAVYKWIMVVLFFFWAIIQESLWLLFTPNDVCVVSCFIGCIAYPKTWWHFVVSISDFLVCATTVILFLSVPMVTICKRKSVFQQIRTECFIIHGENIYLTQRQCVARVRLLSFIYVAGFTCTLFWGTVLSDYVCNVNTVSASYLNLAAEALQNVHVVFSPFIFLLDASFRHEVKRLFSKKR